MGFLFDMAIARAELDTVGQTAVTAPPREGVRLAPPVGAAVVAGGISVVVLTRNRLALLRRCLASLEAQHTHPLEVIVVDNGGDDGSGQMVRSEFPGVTLIENGQNLGITGRNIGFAAARGEWILSLDDDVELTDPTTLDRIPALFASHEGVGAVTLKILEETSGSDFVANHWWHPRDRLVHQDREFETDRINEAAVVFDAEAIRRVGYYYEALFWGGEEWDLVLGLFDEGYSIRYAPIPVLHLAPRGDLNVKADHRHALLVRNRFWIALRRLPLLQALAFGVPRLALWGVRAARYGYVGHYCRGLGDLLRRLPEILRDRRPISAETRRRLRAVRRAGA